MGTEPGKYWEFLAANEDIHRIDLDDSHVVESSTKMTTINSALRPLAMKTLSREGGPARLRNR